MAKLSNITRAAVLRAVAEYDKLGRVNFLTASHSGPSRTTWLSYPAGKYGTYDAKAICRWALAKVRPRKEPYEFHGGEPVRHRLEELGFEVLVGQLLSADDADEDVYVPKNEADARSRVYQLIVQRRGQLQFRNKLLRAYDGCCAVSGCKVKDVLEAAHIDPYNGENTNRVANGLLLRADLHTLFDIGLVSVNESSMRILIAPSLRSSVYKQFHGKRLRTIVNGAQGPDRNALKRHRLRSGVRWRLGENH